MVKADDVFVIGTAMLTPIGLSSQQTAAAVRASISQFRESAWLDVENEPFMTASVDDDKLLELPGNDPALAHASARELRLLRLAKTALLECLEIIGQLSKPLKTGLMLALPSAESEDRLDASQWKATCSSQLVGPGTWQSIVLQMSGRAGGLELIGKAAHELNRGALDVVLVGGVDTHQAYPVIQRLEAERRIKSADILDGFIPGEGAAFLVLAGGEFVTSRKLTPLVSLSDVALGFEEGHLQSDLPYRGEGLAETFKALFRIRQSAETIQDVFSSMNGESYWAKEWGVGYLRSRTGFAPDHELHHPADCLGDLGAAAGPLLVGLATIGIGRGYRRAPCLAYSSSDTGERAALIIRQVGT